MALTSLKFAIFFTISLTLYYIIPIKLQLYYLILDSIFFYILSVDPFTLIYICACICTVYYFSIKIAKEKNNLHKRKFLLVIGIIINVSLLGAIKYNIFIIKNANVLLNLFHVSMQIPEVRIMAPLGISYYTFAAISYLIDVYWEISEQQEDIRKLSLFIVYYPQLTSGPIMYYREIKEQLYCEHKFDYNNLAFGIQRILWGVFKKLVISVRLGIIVDTIYGNTIEYSGLYIWLAALLFMFQLYTDFSGCMDIVIGASECYGIVLKENFRTPFFSRSVQEFWQRWHITLGGWMRDYIMYPILRCKRWQKLTKWIKTHFGKKAAKMLPSYLAMLCVWLLMGLWHGGSWKYVLGMGIWFWGIITLSKVFEPLFKKIINMLHINTNCFSWHLFQSIQVFVLVCIGNMFFRLNGLITTFRVMRSGLRWNPWIFFDGSIYQLGLDRQNIWISIFGVMILLVVSVLQEQGKNVRQRLAEQNIVFRWIIIIGLIISIIIFGMYGPEFNSQSFIYEQF